MSSVSSQVANMKNKSRILCMYYFADQLKCASLLITVFHIFTVPIGLKQFRIAFSFRTEKLFMVILRRYDKVEFDIFGNL